MPMYDQHCRDCDAEFEILALSFDAPRPCPHCLSVDTEQLVSLPNFQLSRRQFEMKRGPSHNPYENLTLQHIQGEDGKPVRVNSERELRAAEKKYNFIHAASWGMENAAPQHDPDAGNIARNYKKKFNRNPSAYRPESESAGKGVSAGVVSDASQTLAHHPNPV